MHADRYERSKKIEWNWKMQKMAMTEIIEYKINSKRQLENKKKYNISKWNVKSRKWETWKYNFEKN